MFRIEVHRNIRRMVWFFYYCGFWHRQDEETVRERRLKFFYSFYFALFPLSLAAGGFETDNQNERIFSVGIVIFTSVFQLKLWYVLWNRNEILEQLNRICDHYIDDRKTFIAINEKLEVFMKFVKVYLNTLYVCEVYIFLIAPFVGTEREFFINYKFPFDWKSNEFAFWIAFLFTFTQGAIAVVLLLFSVIVWYLMANCGWKYEVLGQQITKMGEMRPAFDGSTDERQLTDAEKDFLYRRDLTKAITSNNQLREMTNQLDTFLSKLFVVQLATGGLCICVSTYSLVFLSYDNLLEPLVYLVGLLYGIFDVFMIMYFGNQIVLTSDKLSYRLYESSWVDRSQSIKKDVLIFGEFLMKPHQLIVLRLYPLTLDTFVRILNSAYSMFNILQNFK